MKRSSLTKIESDFPSLREFNDYLETVETLSNQIKIVK